MTGSVWTLVPPIVAIALALWTKEVYFSLLAGIVIGALFYTQFAVIDSINTIITIMSDKVGGNICIIIFLVLLGMLVALMSKSGASKAYGEWASKNIKTKKGALLATAGLGVLIFVDDYFNCLTVGTVMSPITDKHKVSRAQLAYIIDATAAPVCILSPVSSWAAAVSSSLPENSNMDGFMLFIRSIPFNYYAIFTLIMILFLILNDFSFSRMKRYNEEHGSEIATDTKSDEILITGHGKVLDLIIPIIALIFFCVSAMLYTGGITKGAGIIDSFADCDAALSLVIGSVFAMIVVALLYLPRKVITVDEFRSSLTEGFKAMVPAILILTFAWTLSGICGNDYLQIGTFVSGLINNSNMTHAIIPAIFFLVALGLAFSTGTSWGTFSIMLPIVFAIFGDNMGSLLLLSMSATMAGAVCGDHISPISDTTILSSTGAGCHHIDHVNTQIPYALLVAAISFVSYLIGGFTGNGYIGLVVGIVGILATLSIIRAKTINA